MSTIKVNKIENTSTTAGGVAIDSSGHVQVDGLQMPTAGALSNRNLIINGAMQVAQRGTSSTSALYQTVDRFQVQFGSISLTQSQETLSSGDPYDEGFRYFYRIQNTSTSTAAGAYADMRQRIEGQNVVQSGWRYNSATSYVTLSFWVRASVAQDYQCYVRTADGTAQVYSFPVTLAANTWTKVTETIPGNASSTIDNDNGSGFEVILVAFFGTDYTDSGSADRTWRAPTGTDYLPDMDTTWASTLNATLDLTGVQLEVGEKATPFEHRSYGDELARCQRYYYEVCNPNITEEALGTGVWWSSASHYFCIFYPVTMRSTPTFDYTVSGGSILAYGPTLAGYLTSPGFMATQMLGTTSSEIYASNWSANTDGTGATVSFTTGYGGWVQKYKQDLRINFDAEL